MAGGHERTSAQIYEPVIVRKESPPLRPTLQSEDAPTYGLAQQLFRHLIFPTDAFETMAISSAQIMANLREVNLMSNEVMVSPSFLTFVPKDLAVDTTKPLLQSKYNEMENRPWQVHIPKPLKIGLKANFGFDGKV
nr:unnamed protein product [Spirometra erinaceieuropaei]